MNKQEKKVLENFQEILKQEGGENFVTLGGELFFDHLKEYNKKSKFTKKELEMASYTIGFVVKLLEMNNNIKEVIGKEDDFDVRQQICVIWYSILKQIEEREQKLNEII